MSNKKRNLIERLNSGPVICAEGFLFEIEKRGYKNSDIENIFYKNWQRFFAVNLP